VRILPATRRDWWQVAISPCKGYLLAVPIVSWSSFVLWPTNNLLFSEGSRRLPAELMRLVELGYGVCLVGLALAAASNPNDQRARRSATLYGVLTIASMFLLFPTTVIHIYK
jgi:hypothetical protein